MVHSRNIKIILLKVLIFLAAWIYVGFKIVEFKDSFSNLHFTSVSIVQITEMMVVILLMICNWSFEAIKWQFVLQNFYILSFFKALQAIMRGTTLGIISPNRVGEPIGRVSQLEPQFRQSGISAGILCSVGQFSTTVLAGIFALPFFLKTSIPFFITLNLAILSIILVLFLYFNVPKIGKLFKRIPFINRYESFILHFQDCSKYQLFIILLYSMIRYFIFILQFYIILKIFLLDISFLHSCIAVSLVYLVTTVIPTTTLAELGIRCSSSVYFIGFYCNKPLLIVAASMSLWVINISLPAILGSILFLPNFREIKQGNEHKK